MGAAGRAARILKLAGATWARGRRAAGPGENRERMLILSAACAEALRILDVEVDVEGAVPPGVTLVASNHLSYLDPIAIASVVPCVPISKAELASWPVFGTVAGLLGVLLVNRESQGSRFGVARAAATTLRDGRSVLNFPEGTTGTGDRILPLRPGLFRVALHLGVPVTPVVVRYDDPELAWTGDATFVPHFVGLLRRRATRVRLVFGAAVSTAGFSTGASLAEAVHARLSGLLEEATPWRKTQP